MRWFGRRRSAERVPEAVDQAPTWRTPPDPAIGGDVAADDRIARSRGTNPDYERPLIRTADGEAYLFWTQRPKQRPRPDDGE